MYMVIGAEPRRPPLNGVGRGSPTNVNCLASAPELRHSLLIVKCWSMFSTAHFGHQEGTLNKTFNPVWPMNYC